MILSLKIVQKVTSSVSSAYLCDDEYFSIFAEQKQLLYSKIPCFCETPFHHFLVVQMLQVHTSLNQTTLLGLFYSSPKDELGFPVETTPSDGFDL